MDSWSVDDLEALAVIGHAGGLTKKGTRPRFRLVGQEADIFNYLHQIDAALNAMGLKPSSWLKAPRSEPPYKGGAPLAYIAAHGLPGAREVMHSVTMRGLQQAL